MSLPNGFLEELRSRVSLSQVVGRKVVWDMRRSNQGKGDYWAPCPFHQEKSASFHVDDRKGFYYCFGCHAKGDALTFLRETENMGFMEAVEVLAREAGMPVPARDPVAAQQADRRSQLAEVMEQAVQFYRLQLRAGAGGVARDYLARRRLPEASQARFELGWAPDTRQGLFAHLRGKGVAPDLIVDAGLAARPEGGGEPYDRYRGRVIFPIRDARGRAISLGGRSLDPNARAKYINGPETELFDKGSSLYNHGPARDAAGKGQQLIVAEGYMDVIALVEAGFEAAVAPLGTAVTEEQLRLMWRIYPEPVIALDGDAAGLRAALRVVDLALPLLEAGQGLRFAILEGGKDPDEILRGPGPAALQKQLDAALPMVALLWRRETEGKVFDSPERKATLDKTLRAALTRIKDLSIRAHYGETIKQLRWELFGTRRPAPGRRGAAFVPQAPLPSTRGSLLAVDDAATGERLREAVILATLIAHPALIHRFEGEMERLDLHGAGHNRLRDAILRHADIDDPAALREKIAAVAGDDLESLFALAHVRIAPPVREAGDAELAAMCLAEELAKLEAARGVLREIREASEDLDGLADEGVTWRLTQAADAHNRAGRAHNEDGNDLGEDRAALSAHLQSLIDAEVWVKKKG
ncbi:MAG: DNA primase [Rhodobacteraceae bacterium]|nr:DNA primase [Paracoccaceae bacterium]